MCEIDSTVDVLRGINWICKTLQKTDTLILIQGCGFFRAWGSSKRIQSACKSRNVQLDAWPSPFSHFHLLSLSFALLLLCKSKKVPQSRWITHDHERFYSATHEKTFFLSIPGKTFQVQVVLKRSRKPSCVSFSSWTINFPASYSFSGWFLSFEIWNRASWSFSSNF